MSSNHTVFAAHFKEQVIYRFLTWLCTGRTVVCASENSSDWLTLLCREGVDAFALNPAGTTNTGKSDFTEFPQRIFNPQAIIDQSIGTFESALCPIIDSLDCTSLDLLFENLNSLGVSTALIVVGSSSPETRGIVEEYFFERGFIKHPRYYDFIPYQELEREGSVIFIPLHKLADGLASRYSLSWLLEERSLHMDMMRESGRRSDGHVIRYHWATSYVRPGDIVVDASCGLGYGSFLLASNSRAMKVIGWDISERAIDYAQNVYASQLNNLSYECKDLAALSGVADSSIDLITSFETLEHLEAPQSFLAECSRILKPSGRLIVSVPNRWVDKTGKDPNPFHHHVYDWATLGSQLKEHFILESFHAQDAGGGYKLPSSPRKLKEVSVSKTESIDSEWCLAVAMISPIRKASVPFVPSIYGYQSPPANLVNFERDYKNPWLVPALVEQTFRLQTTEARVRLAMEVLEYFPQRGADRGAALCVLGYSYLETWREHGEFVQELLIQIEQYLSQPSNSPHDFRWGVSLSYLAAEFQKRFGNFEKAANYYQVVAQSPVENFSPMLATKVFAALANLARFSFLAGKRSQAKQWLTQSVQILERICTCEFEEIIGARDAPLSCNYWDSLVLTDLSSFNAELLGWLEREERDGIPTQGFLNSSIFQSSKKSFDELAFQSKVVNELFEVAENRLSDIRELDKQKQELYDIAESRLIELNKVVASADSYLKRIQELDRDKAELFEIAEIRLRDMKDLAQKSEDLKVRYALLDQSKQELETSASARQQELIDIKTSIFFIDLQRRLGRFIRSLYSRLSAKFFSQRER